jgi:beta-glucosidase
VLLKNEHGTLPLMAKKMKHIVVLGPNATGYPTGGGSAHVEPFHYVSVLEGLRKAAGSKVTIDSIPGPGPELLEGMAPNTRFEGPLKLEFLESASGYPKVIATLADDRIDADWEGRAPAPGVDPANYRARWTGSIKAPASGSYVFMAKNHGNINVKLDGKVIIGSWSNPNDTLFAYATLEAGKTYPIQVEARYEGQGSPAVRFAWGAAPPDLTDEDARRIRSADAVVVCAGFNLMLEGEGADRTYELPNQQSDLIRKVAALNPRTIVVLNSGGVVATADWVGQVPALLQAWYPGQEGGRALAEILLGTVNPSAKLPISYEKRREDSPSFGNYPGTNGKVDYAEGIFVGYRWFDAKGVAPLFPFGFGLSYTTFHYAKLQVDPAPDGHWTVTYEVTNNGTRNGDEVSEIYVSPPAPSRVTRAVRELKGFSRVSLATDETKVVTVVLDRHAFEYFDEAKGAWEVEPGSYTIAVGSSSRDLRLTAPVDLP